jgi:hypothetical protein
VIVDVAPGDKPVTVKTRLDPEVEVSETDPEVTEGVPQVKLESKFVIVTVKPSTVDVGVPKTGSNAASALTNTAGGVAAADR